MGMVCPQMAGGSSRVFKNYYYAAINAPCVIIIIIDIFKVA